MDASKPGTEIAPAQPAASPCQNKTSESAGFVANIRESTRKFFYSTPMEGHKGLDASKPATETAPAAQQAASSCQRKTSETETAGFMANTREFFHTPMEEHKACLKAQYHKFTAKFGKGSGVLKEGENSVPLQTTVKN